MRAINQDLLFFSLRDLKLWKGICIQKCRSMLENSVVLWYSKSSYCWWPAFTKRNAPLISLCLNKRYHRKRWSFKEDTRPLCSLENGLLFRSLEKLWKKHLNYSLTVANFQLHKLTSIWMHILKGNGIWLNRGEVPAYFDCLHCPMTIITKMEYVPNLE